MERNSIHLEMDYYYDSGFMVNHMSKREFEIRKCRDMLRLVRKTVKDWPPPFCRDREGNPHLRLPEMKAHLEAEIDRLETKLEKLQKEA